MEVHCEVSEQRSGNSSKHRSNHEGQNFEARRVHAHRFSCNFVIANGDECSPVTGSRYISDRNNCDDDEKIHPEEIAQFCNSDKTSGSADCIYVQNKHSNNFTKSERNNCEIISAQTKGWDSNDQTSNACN